MATRQIRVLHVLGSMNPGGVETWLLNVLKFADREQFKFDICTFGAQPGLYAAEVERIGGSIVPCPRDHNLWSFPRRFRQILRQGEYDIVHSHVTLFSGAVLRWANAEGVPVRIAHSHTSADDKANAAGRRFYRRLMKRWIDRYATLGLAASRLAAAELFGENWENDGRVQILHCGIDLSQFEEPIFAEEVRRELGIPIGATVIGHVGRFVAAKNHRFFLEVAAEIRETQPDAHFLLVGDGPLRPEIESRAKSMGFNGNIHFAGARSDVPRLMRGAMDVFLFPSRWEGLPVALIEAQAAGLPCVVSRSITEEATLSDTCFRLALTRSPQEWAHEALNAASKRPFRRAASIGALAESDFSAKRSACRLSNLYSNNL